MFHRVAERRVVAVGPSATCRRAATARRKSRHSGSGCGVRKRKQMARGRHEAAPTRPQGELLEDWIGVRGRRARLWDFR